MGGIPAEGLTKTYNRFNDPEETLQGILELRRLHGLMDERVLAAYGWEDLIPRCRSDFLLEYEDEDDSSNVAAHGRKRPCRYGWPDEIRDEVLARLLELNGERAREEQLTERTSTDHGARVARIAKRNRFTDLAGASQPPLIQETVK